jgi:very-short-patch-repair endonuclease
MPKESVFAALSALSAANLGVFRGREATARQISRRQLAALRAEGVVERVHPDTYRLTAVPRSAEQALRAALVWAGESAAAAGRSAGELYGLAGVHATSPEIVVPPSVRARSDTIIVHHGERSMSMVRELHGFRVTGIECTLLQLAAALDGEALEIACEDARRRRLTSIPALRAYIERFGRRGRRGLQQLRRLLDELDPAHPSRSTLEVKARRLLVANGITHFVREFPLDWEGRTYLFDFAFEPERVVLETNGRRWHDDPADFDHDNEKWSVPGHHGYRIVFATWSSVSRRP